MKARFPRVHSVMRKNFAIEFGDRPENLATHLLLTTMLA